MKSYNHCVNYVTGIVVMRRHRFESLDAMRGLAALIVLLFHVCQTHAPWMFPRGYLAVDLFFILSGFVIAYAYEDRLIGGLPKASFLYARLVRLYPLIVAGAVIGAIGFSKLYSLADLAIVFFTGLLLLPTPFAPASEDFMAIPVNPPSWSLLFEILVNVAFMIVASRLSNRRLVHLLVVSAIALVVSIAYFGAATFGAKWTNFGAGTTRVCFSFFAGVAIYRLWRGQMLTFLRLPLAVSLLGLVLLFLIPTQNDVDGIIDAVAILVVFPAIVACGANVSVSGRFLRLGVIWGELSYPLYILQGGVAPHIRDLPTKFGAHDGAALAIIMLLVAVYVLVCWVILKFYDEPIRRFLMRDGGFMINGRRHAAALG